MNLHPDAVVSQLLEAFADAVARRVVELQRCEPAFAASEAEERSPWLSVEKAAAYVDWPKQRLYKLTAAGAVPHYKHEGRLVFNRRELDEWLARHVQPGRPG